jgi:hypothetical protein
MGRDAASAAGLDTVVAIQPPSVGLLKFYDKEGLIANQENNSPVAKQANFTN